MAGTNPAMTRRPTKLKQLFCCVALGGVAGTARTAFWR